MAECTDKRLADMLHHYELGLLADEDAREFELHLYTCDQCFAKVQQFSPAAALMRHDPDVREAVRRMALEEPAVARTKSEDEAAPAHRRRRWWVVVPSIAAVVTLILLVAKDWDVEFRPTKEVQAVENRLAVLSFLNLADEPDSLRLGEIAANLLIADLSESRYMQVVSTQRIYDALKSLGKSEVRTVDRGMAMTAAREVRAEWVLTGTILQVTPRFELTSELVDVPSGRVIASQRVRGDAGEDIFGLVDRLTMEVKRDLALPAAAGQEPDRQVVEVTTSSTEAYRAYLEGMELHRKYYYADAARSFRRALQYDSTLAMAYYYLSLLDDVRLIDRAAAFLDRTGRREQHFIRSRQALLSGDTVRAARELRDVLEEYPDDKEPLFLLGVLSRDLGQFDSAITYFTRVIQIDPGAKTVYNMLAYTYENVGNFDSALWALDQYAALAPDEPNPYDSRGEIYALNGKLDEAIASYEQALRIRPDFASSWMSLGYMYLFQEDYAAAERCLQEYHSLITGEARAGARLYLAYIPCFRGKLEQALRLLDDAIAADRLELSQSSRPRGIGWKQLLKSRIHVELGNPARAVQEFEQYLQLLGPSDSTSRRGFLAYYVQLLAENNEFTKAEKVAEELKPKAGTTQGPDFPYAEAAIALSSGRPDSAIAMIERIPARESLFSTRFILARLYLEAKRFPEAVAEFEQLQKVYTSRRAFSCLWSVKIHYYLGQAYEQSGRPELAIAQYRKFLDIWKDADPRIRELADARQRLARLTTPPS